MKYLSLTSDSPTGPSFVISESHPPSPATPCNPGPADLVYTVLPGIGGPRVAPELVTPLVGVRKPPGLCNGEVVLARLA